jgi:DNA primase
MYESEKLKILKDIFGSSHKSGEEVLFFCPKCNHTKRKLSINIDKNVWKCWFCDFRGNNLSRLVKRFGSFLQREEWNKYSNTVDISFSLENLFRNEVEEKEEVCTKLPKEFISLCNQDLPLSSVEAKKYLLNRGITKQDILKWKIGYCSSGEYKGRVIIPSFNNDGMVNYFVARSYGKEWPSYKNPNVSKDIVFNQLYVDFKNDLVLVEGAFDAIKAENAVPILGSSLREDSKLFQEIVKWDTTVYVALDPDAEKKAMKLIKSLLLYGIEVYKIDVTGYKDVGEMDKREFLKRKNEAKIITNEGYLCEAFSSFNL